VSAGADLVADARRALGTGFAGRCIGGNEADMVLANKQHAAALPLPRPAVLIRCRTGQDVARALAFVRDRAIPFSVRSGGHCFADHSNQGQAIIDCAELDAIGVDADGRVVAGPGALAGDAIRALLPAGLTLPVGGCPLVALGGLALVGGFGLTGRSRGLLCDRLTALQVVLADSRTVDCDAQTHPDLFWALTGAGPLGFGIVTRLTFDPAPLRSGVAISAVWPIEQAAGILAVWQHWAPLADNSLCLQLSLMAPEDPDAPCFLRGYGVLLDSPRRDAILDDLAVQFGGDGRMVCTALSAADLMLYAAGLQTQTGAPAWLPSRPYTGTALQAQRSQFFAASLPRAAIPDIIARLQRDRTAMQLREIECIPWRGRYAEDHAASCFAHRGAHMLLRYNALTGRAPTTDITASMRAWTDDCRDMLAAHADGHVYAGYAEPDIADPMAQYFGAGAMRLTSLKAQYDPDGLFMAYNADRAAA